MIHLVWDLDGTLIDSYPAIVASLEATYAHYGWVFDRAFLSQYILDYSVGQLLRALSQEHSVSYETLKDYYSSDLKGRDGDLRLFPETLAILAWTKQNGIVNFIYTHKGDNTEHVLKILGIADYFTEVLHSQSGFARKPDREAMDYLVDKYGLDRQATYYVGDRKLDMDFALASGVRSINLTQPSCSGNIGIKRLFDISALPIFEEM